MYVHYIQYIHVQYNVPKTFIPHTDIESNYGCMYTHPYSPILYLYGLGEREEETQSPSYIPIWPNPLITLHYTFIAFFSLSHSLSLSFFPGQIISLSARLLGETPITLLHGPVLALHWPCISPYSGFPSAFATLVPACLPFVWPRLKLKVREHNKTEYRMLPVYPNNGVSLLLRPYIPYILIISIIQPMYVGIVHIRVHTCTLVLYLLVTLSLLIHFRISRSSFVRTYIP